MRYLYILVSLVCIVLVLIVYFQNLASMGQAVFLKSYIRVPVLLLDVVTVSFAAGATMVLGIKGFLSKGKSGDDGYDL